MTIPTPIEPIVNRWHTFFDKVRARFQEVLTEADAGYDEVMNIEIVDPAVLSGATSAFQARVRGLQDKVRDAWSKIEQEISQVIQDTEDSSECEKMYPVRSAEQHRGLQLIDDMERQTEALRIHKEAKAARLLKEVADREMQEPKICSHCGAPLVVPTPYKATSVTCSHCQAVNSVHPGIATGLYYQGGALHNLAQETALTEWQAQVQAEKRYKAWRHPLQEDWAQFEKATETYWKAYFSAMKKLHPDWTEETYERELNARMGQWRQLTDPHNEQHRQHVTSILELAATGDRVQVIQWFRKNRQRPDSFSEEVLEAAHEHRLEKVLPLLLDTAHELSGTDDPKSDWIEEKRQDLIRYIPVLAQ